MKTFIALLSVSLIALAAAQYGTGLNPSSTTNASLYSWTTGCAYVTSWASSSAFAYCGGCVTTGYYQNTTQSTCTAINTTLTPHCVAVSSANTSVCIACATGYYLSSGACTLCNIPGATACSNSTFATAASAGYYIPSTGTPAPCTWGGSSITGCALCDPSGSNYCIACGAGTWLSEMGSTSCTATDLIAGCYYGYGGICSNPAPYYFNSSGTFKSTTTNITNCVLYGSSTSNCTGAALGYMATSSGSVIPCTAIITTGDSTCSGPAAGYYVNASTSSNGAPIVAVPTGVATAIFGQNLTCSTGYYLAQNGQCISGSLTDPNCAIGNSTSVCVGCNSGYYFSTNLTCGACGSNCGTCTNSSICTACTNTTLYTLNSNGTCTNKTSSANILAPSFAILSMIFYYLF